jgi:hypothetical protein
VAYYCSIDVDLSSRWGGAQKNIRRIPTGIFFKVSAIRFLCRRARCRNKVRRPRFTSGSRYDHGRRLDFARNHARRGRRRGICRGCARGRGTLRTSRACRGENQKKQRSPSNCACQPAVEYPKFHHVLNFERNASPAESQRTTLALPKASYPKAGAIPKHVRKPQASDSGVDVELSSDRHGGVTVRRPAAWFCWRPKSLDSLILLYPIGDASRAFFVRSASNVKLRP